MKIYNKLKINIDTGQVIAEDSFEYVGPIAQCGPSGSTTTTAVDEAYNARMATLSEEQQGWYRQMLNLFKYGEEYDPKAEIYIDANGNVVDKANAFNNDTSDAEEVTDPTPTGEPPREPGEGSGADEQNGNGLDNDGRDSGYDPTTGLRNDYRDDIDDLSGSGGDSPLNEGNTGGSGQGDGPGNNNNEGQEGNTNSGRKSAGGVAPGDVRRTGLNDPENTMRFISGDGGGGGAGGGGYVEGDDPGGGGGGGGGGVNPDDGYQQPEGLREGITAVNAGEYYNYTGEGTSELELMKQGLNLTSDYYKQALEGVDVNQRVQQASSDVAQGQSQAAGALKRDMSRSGVSAQSNLGIKAKKDLAAQHAKNAAFARTNARVGAERESFDMIRDASGNSGLGVG